MKYICFGYLDTTRWATLSESEQKAALDRCFDYDDLLKKNGHWVAGEALHGRKFSQERQENGFFMCSLRQCRGLARVGDPSFQKTDRGWRPDHDH